MATFANKIENSQNMKKLFKLLYITLLLISCKHEEVVDITGTYTSQNVEIGTIKLYSKSGEIKDPNTINKFINVHDSSLHYFAQNSDWNNDFKNNGKIIILPTNEVKLLNFGDSAIYNLKNYNQIQYLESKDTTKYSLKKYFSFNEDLHSKPFYERMLMYNPIYSDTVVLPSTSAIYLAIRLKECKYIILSKNNIKYPLLTYHYFQSRHYSSRAEKNINNVFNEATIKELNETDTIAIQQINLIFSK